MRFLSTNYPKFCPQCGADLTPKSGTSYIKNDFEAGCSYTCDCGAQYQNLNEDMVDLLAEEGMLDSHWDAE